MARRIAIGLLAAALLVGIGLAVAWYCLPSPGPFVAGQRLVYGVDLTSAGHTDFSRAMDGDAAVAAARGAACTPASRANW